MRLVRLIFIGGQFLPLVAHELHNVGERHILTTDFDARVDGFKGAITYIPESETHNSTYEVETASETD
jgi:hypothetical protein